VNKYVTHACSAILKLHDQVIRLPNEEERKNISALDETQNKNVCMYLAQPFD